MINQNRLKMWLFVASIFGSTGLVPTCEVSQDCTPCATQCSQAKNTFFPRPFSSNASLEIMQEKTVFQTESDRNEWNGTFSFATEYMQNFGAKCNSTCKNLGSMPFWGAAGTNTMTIGNNDGRADLDAWNFGLGNVQVDADGIAGTISLNPKITHVGTDFLLYFTQFKDRHGMYFKIHAPIAAFSMDVQVSETETEIVETNAFTETSTTAQTLTYLSNYPNLLDRFPTVSNAFAGGVGDGNTLDGHGFDQIVLTFGKLSTCKQTEIRLADLSAVWGYNLWANEKGLIGLGFKATCATGNVPTAQYALEPIVGRAGLWGVGADVMAHYKAWENEAQTRYLDMWFQGEVLHLVPGRTPSMRSFDLLANGKGSKYLLVQRFKAESNATYSAAGLTQAINITTLPVISKFAVEGCASLMADFHCHNWNLAIAGEFWGRSKENLAIDMCSAVEQNRHNLNNYAVVGRQVSSFNIIAPSTYTGDVLAVVPLCEPLAKINESQNVITLVGGDAALATFPTTYPDGIADATNPANRIPADLTEALDICGAAASKALTGKVFGQFGYTWNDNRYTPNLSVFGSAEFTNQTNNAVQMWAAGIQGSLNF